MKGLFIGITSIDIIYPFDHYPNENVKNRCKEVLVDIGGPASNAAYSFSALGGNATLVSMVGQNPFREFIMSKFDDYGIIHFDLNKNLSRQPGLSSIVSNKSSGSRTIIESQPKEIEPIDFEILDAREYDIICVDGYFGDYALEVLRLNKKNIPVLLDAGSFKTYTEDLLRYTTYPIFSENFKPNTSDSIEDYLKNRKHETFAITKGNLPIIGFDKGMDFEIQIESINAIDTLGAGDIFHGAFAKYILETDDFQQSLVLASKVASLSCQFLGTREWSSRYSKIDHPRV